MKTPAELHQFRRLLLDWFDAHARDLPWRRTDDPYAIWVSEIMLQQTRVNAVLDHYARFLSRFPTIAALAMAEEPEVLAVWSGLGYYRRARMLHKAAKAVVNDLGGKLPETADLLRRLPGIGEYTKAAIASIAFSEPIAAVDGNVERVVMRLTGSEATNGSQDRAVRETAQALLDQNRPGDFNQAMMELGATLCLPKNPLCLECPVQGLCRTRGEHPTVKRPKMRSKAIYFAFIERKKRKNSSEILLEQRPHDASLMAGMWELPHLDPTKADPNRLLLSLRHSITTTNYQVSILRFAPEEEASLPEHNARKWIKADEVQQLPLTGLARKALKRLHLLPGNTSTILPVKAPAATRGLLFPNNSVAE
ncbi:A/G-specific adenine glycosylase [Alloacidobacterium dinghuense]|uniref:Adenine DNA glycosylase n=1 Tax=Alloacidobacterium dinghuense TaxID=2763107 RepID=A0A7G8BHJ6_9BACT|nr:A/G-specific adenine glycosylase [Alloacidobacterium dinghuense]QNI32016.1 A/G-specific adenine glycosylase [Alloacidobacterium dinghuense]